MATASLWDGKTNAWTVEDYLHTRFDPDCDFVDGAIEERNVGEYEHASVQKMLMRVFLEHEAAWGVEAIQECRLQVSASRFRVPDTMVLRAGHRVDRIVRDAPLLCIEVISPDDTWGRLSGVLGDYLAMGVRHIWALDPEKRRAYRFDEQGFHLVVEELLVDGTEIRVKVEGLFPGPRV